MDGGVRAGGAVPVAVEVEAVAVEAEPLDLGGEEVEELVPLLEVGKRVWWRTISARTSCQKSVSGTPSWVAQSGAR